GHAVSVCLQAIDSGLDNLRVICQAEIVVRAEIQDRALVHADTRALRAQDLPLGFVEALRANVGKLGIKGFFERRVGHG
ncbi:MAG: hypothetical protein HP492_02560, partial [Nitrospira sp.]|nr:hypothetical protein [Nitrospira sp.]